MSLQTSTQQETATGRKLALALMIAVIVVALMALATVALGVQATGPFTDFVPDPAGLSGLAF